MKEIIIKCERGPFPKKYTAFIQNKKTPLSGGLVIFLVLFYFLPESYKYFTIIMFIIFLSGLLSDLNILHAPFFRIFFQTIASVAKQLQK